jgi:hypothetical protein
MEPNQPPLRKCTTARERREYRIFMQLRRLPQFRELVANLTRGQSIRKVTDWLMQQPNREELSNCTFGTARKYIGVLSQRLRDAERKVPRKNLEDLRRALVQEHQNTQVTEAITNLPDPAQADMERVLTDELQRQTAISMLQYCFGIQRERVIQLRDLERTTRVIFPFGNKSVQVLKEIAGELGKVQAGEALLHSKNAWPTGSDASGPAIELLPEVRRVSELDSVDNDLIREALDRTIDLLEQERMSDQHSFRVKDEPRDKKSRSEQGLQT